MAYTRDVGGETVAGQVNPSHERMRLACATIHTGHFAHKDAKDYIMASDTVLGLMRFGQSFSGEVNPSNDTIGQDITTIS